MQASTSPRFNQLWKWYKKLLNNILSTRAASVLGLGTYVYYLANFIVLLPKISARGDLNPLDAAMGGKRSTFNYRGRQIYFDTSYCDRQINDGTYAFGAVREIYIRDCYFRHFPRNAYASTKSVVDLGANRGAFSALVAGQAERVVSVEVKEEFREVIEHNMRLNKAMNSTVLVGFVGSGGRNDDAGIAHYSMDELFQTCGIASVDLMKIDIEGSEYALFTGDTAWLDRVQAITMEVHPAYGCTGAIVAKLKQHGFICVMATEDLERIDMPDEADFIYAWKAT